MRKITSAFLIVVMLAAILAIPALAIENDNIFYQSTELTVYSDGNFELHDESGDNDVQTRRTMGYVHVPYPGVELALRTGPGTTYSIITRLSNGTVVQIYDTATDSSGRLWLLVRVTSTNQAGWVDSAYIV